MKTKLTKSTSFQIFSFLGVFGFSIGLFNNYRELWMNANGIDATTISRIIGISSIITVLVLLFFTLKVTTDKLKQGISISLVLKLITSTSLICLNNTNNYFLIKLMMFFDIAFSELILSSIYPFIMSIAKDDVIYTKKDVIESIFNKFGFLIASILLGKMLFNKIIDYNSCYLLSVIFCFIAFILFIRIEVDNEKEKKELELKEIFLYFKNNQRYIFFLITTLLSGITWSTMMGMPLLTLTQKLNIASNMASFMILGLGIVSNILAILIVKYFRFKNDNINMFFKYGFRIILYLLVFLIGTKIIYLITFIYLLLSDCPYGFLISGRFINEIEEKYSLLLVVLKYCANLIGNGIGVLICGVLFNLPLKYITIPAFLVGIIHYIIATILISKKHLVRS